MTIPIDDEPRLEILGRLDVTEEVPHWFKENPCKYGLLKDHKKGLLLDAGCGQGNRGTFEKLGYTYIGMDISPNSNQKHDGPADVDIVAGCHRVPLPSQILEVVTCDAVLEHLYWPMLAVKELHRLLKPGGILLGSCSFLEGEHFDSQCHLSYLGFYRLLRTGGFDVHNIRAGLSLWEMHAGSIFLDLPGHRLLGRLHRKLYLKLVRFKGNEGPQHRLLRHAAILHFVAVKV